jgi:hypothetical protein
MSTAPAPPPKPPEKPAGGKQAAGADRANTEDNAAGAETETETDTPADATLPATAAGSESSTGAGLVPTPYDPEYERPISELPPLTFPNSEDYEFRQAADRRRKTRIRNEAVFGAVLVVVGLFVLIAARTPAFLGLAAIAAVAMAAYELTISGLE